MTEGRLIRGRWEVWSETFGGQMTESYAARPDDVAYLIPDWLAQRLREDGWGGPYRAVVYEGMSDAERYGEKKWSTAKKVGAGTAVALGLWLVFHDGRAKLWYNFGRAGGGWQNVNGRWVVEPTRIKLSAYGDEIRVGGYAGGLLGKTVSLEEAVRLAKTKGRVEIDAFSLTPYGKYEALKNALVAAGVKNIVELGA